MMSSQSWAFPSLALTSLPPSSRPSQPLPVLGNTVSSALCAWLLYSPGVLSAGPGVSVGLGQAAMQGPARPWFKG